MQCLVRMVVLLRCCVQYAKSYNMATQNSDSSMETCILGFWTMLSRLVESDLSKTRTLALYLLVHVD